MLAITRCIADGGAQGANLKTLSPAQLQLPKEKAPVIQLTIMPSMSRNAKTLIVFSNGKLVLKKAGVKREERHLSETTVVKLVADLNDAGFFGVDVERTKKRLSQLSAKTGRSIVSVDAPTYTLSVTLPGANNSFSWNDLETFLAKYPMIPDFAIMKECINLVEKKTQNGSGHVEGAGQSCAVEDGDTRVKVPDTGRAVSGGKPAQTASP